MAKTFAPYVVNIPQSILNSGDQEMIDWYAYDNKWKQDINVNLDFGDALDNIRNGAAFENSVSSAEYHSINDSVEQIEDSIPVHQVSDFRPLIVSANYTAIDRDFVDCRLSAKITLDSNANYNSQIITANGDSTVIEIYSAIQIRYKGQRGNSVLIRNEGTTLHWHLFESDTEQFWRPR